MSDLPKRPFPPPPMKEAALDERGLFTPAWQRWLNELYVRTGGKLALSNIQLEEEFDDLEVRVAALE
jgi:hypothetical protein